MYGKIINNRLVVAGERIIEGRTVITRPTVEKLKELGYKEIDYFVCPSYNEEEEKLKEIYIEEENKIYINYEIVTLTDEEHNEVIKQKIVDEENKITKRNILDFTIDNDQKAKELIDTHRNIIIALRTKLRRVENTEE